MFYKATISNESNTTSFERGYVVPKRDKQQSKTVVDCRLLVVAVVEIVLSRVVVVVVVVVVDVFLSHVNSLYVVSCVFHSRTLNASAIHSSFNLIGH